MKIPHLLKKQKKHKHKPTPAPTPKPTPKPTPEPTPSPQPQPTCIFQDSFEGALSKKWATEFPNKVYSGTISTKYAKDGASSLRIELTKNDPEVYGGKRSEIALATPELPLQEHIYTFSIYLPRGGDEDFAIDPKGSEIIAQWHGTPDPGESGVYPSLALHTGAYYNKPDHYTLEATWDASPLSSSTEIDKKGTHAHYDLGSFLDDKGKWVTWKFHIKWGWQESQNPSIQIYKNGSSIFELKNHPNTTNDKKGIYLKLGIYKWDWAQKGSSNQSSIFRRVIYYDDVCIEKL